MDMKSAKIGCIHFRKTRRAENCGARSVWWRNRREMEVQNEMVEVQSSRRRATWPWRGIGDGRRHGFLPVIYAAVETALAGIIRHRQPMVGCYIPSGFQWRSNWRRTTIGIHQGLVVFGGVCWTYDRTNSRRDALHSVPLSANPADVGGHRSTWADPTAEGLPTGVGRSRPMSAHVNMVCRRGDGVCRRCHGMQ
ncbi:hypothetical protein B0H19DRAFT_1079446 [Mycena capillaripes]|nr:hypothetical protein B0H19DRAFT_1079446 [Mycena capillaripes]